MSNLTARLRDACYNAGQGKGHYCLWTEAADALDAAEAKLAAIDALHTPVASAWWSTTCRHDDCVWPCPTHRILHLEADL